MTPSQAVAVLLDAVIWHGHRLNDAALELVEHDPTAHSALIAALAVWEGDTWEGAQRRLKAVQAATNADIRPLFGLWCDDTRPMQETVTDAITVLWRANERRRLTTELQRLETATP